MSHKKHVYNYMEVPHHNLPLSCHIYCSPKIGWVQKSQIQKSFFSFNLIFHLSSNPEPKCPVTFPYQLVLASLKQAFPFLPAYGLLNLLEVGEPTLHNTLSLMIATLSLCFTSICVLKRPRSEAIVFTKLELTQLFSLLWLHVCAALLTIAGIPCKRLFIYPVKELGSLSIKSPCIPSRAIQSIDPTMPACWQKNWLFIPHSLQDRTSWSCDWICSECGPIRASPSLFLTADP